MNSNVLLIVGALLILGAMYLPRAYDNSPWSILPAIILFAIGLGTFAGAFSEERKR